MALVPKDMETLKENTKYYTGKNSKLRDSSDRYRNIVLSFIRLWLVCWKSDTVYPTGDPIWLDTSRFLISGFFIHLNNDILKLPVPTVAASIHTYEYLWYPAFYDILYPAGYPAAISGVRSDAGWQKLPYIQCILKCFQCPSIRKYILCNFADGYPQQTDWQEMEMMEEDHLSNTITGQVLVFEYSCIRAFFRTRAVSKLLFTEPRTFVSELIFTEPGAVSELWLGFSQPFQLAENRQFLDINSCK